MDEKINNLCKNQEEIKSDIAAIKNTLESFNSRLGETEDRISELEDTEAKHTQTELQLEKKLKEVIEALEINSCTSDTEMCTWHNGSTMQLQFLETHPVPGLNTYRIKHLHVCGMSPELQVDFHTGTKEDSDIAFCFRVYFGNCVVMNSRQCGDWKSEKYEGMPFVDGQPFELCISVLQNEYQVKISTHALFSTVENVLRLHLQPCFLPVLSFCQFSDKDKWPSMLHIFPSTPAKYCEDDPGVERCLPDFSECVQ
ncbi:uncharacterized protein LOC129147620 isoform X1 [Eptesicus fuscus]|uniref:uncharacterized protein LOC129147620 isoform X1 n=1 Tax=Eptesicus fuscus TaxID=29078 RepID=UPI0024046013|nr:uncharacterized protein LOC129147620 isoform X1 [Eptesicus fuscus]XP_054566356.1 uncharacterized protein LOC129147620 isoform X1 [Eptesicus fuscus]